MRLARLIPLALLGILALLLAATSTAQAVPDGGAGANTPGTNASASPRTLTAGSTIHFTVSGFPAGEVVYLKIDDGNFCSSKGIHGACVVHQQRLTGNGTAAGSFVLPADLKPGHHWLRFLASKEMTDSSGSYLGTKGWTTRRGADFTVAKGAASTAGGGASSGGTEAAGAAALAPGETLVVPAPEGGSAPSTPSASPTAEATPVDPEAGTGGGMAAGEKASIEAAVEAVMADEPTTPAATPAAEKAGFPWVGTVGLVVLLVASGGLVLRTRRRA